ncbi:MAG TPA: hypothetical protein VFX64_05985 [Candidatus Nitrosotalea sp.]|nr:hypothetical protein [Candidatus Nitrosotalea sp.]
MAKSPHDPNTVATLLHDYDVRGTHVPYRVRICAVLYASGEISQNDFSNMVKHLYPKNLLA